jgi:antitoxin (DNA-binding transcriptional repressor) of toxin-antitoxin stability system
MQRAHAGERFLVTRRGKPYVRLTPAFDQPELASTEDEGRGSPAQDLDGA